jgi:hypothetical protein
MMLNDHMALSDGVVQRRRSPARITRVIHWTRRCRRWCVRCLTTNDASSSTCSRRAPPTSPAWPQAALHPKRKLIQVTAFL